MKSWQFLVAPDPGGIHLDNFIAGGDSDEQVVDRRDRGDLAEVSGKELVPVPVGLRRVG
jgi:hypothetical protein